MKPPIKKFLYRLDTMFNFGAHIGETVEYVIDTQPSYIEWCLDEIKNFQLDDHAYKRYASAIDVYNETRAQDYGEFFGSDLF